MGAERLRFLVVEDQGFQRWLIDSLLRGMGAQVVLTANDGNAALDLLRGTSPGIDVVITDLDMPGMDGLEFIRHVGQSGRDVSLIVASSIDRAVVSSVSAMAGAYGVALLGAIQKPVTAQKLGEAIARHGGLRPEPARAVVPISSDEISSALADGQLDAYFQPKVELPTGRVVGAEALARWRHPYRGVLPAHAFIEALEEAGFVGRLTLLMLQRAAAASRAWRAADISVVIAVNLSLRSVADVDLADRLTEIVGAQGLDPRQFVLEVTESAEAADLGQALESLSRLRMRGFGLSIDDYGMGYSSLQQLALFPFTELKIDRGFVHDAVRHEAGRAMLASSVEMASKLGIAVVAEGVETQAQWDLLRELGCRLAQGYLIGRAMPADEFAAWVARRHAET